MTVKKEKKEEFMATKPWLGQIIEPSVPADADSSAPTQKLEVEFVHGYRAHDTRQNAFLNCEGKVVSFCAALGMVLDTKSNTQQFLYGHTDDITCAAIHPDGKTIATGQMGKRPRILVWDSTTMTIKATLLGHKRGILTVAFSQSGNTIASVGHDNEQTMYLWDWAAGTPSGSVKCGNHDVMHATFQGSCEDHVAVCGRKMCNFVVPNSAGTALRCKRGTFKHGKLQTVYATAPHGKYTLGACADGSLYIFKGSVVGKAVKGVHDGRCTAVHSNGHTIVTGGRDNKVCVFDGRKLKQLNTFTLEDHVRSVFITADGKTILAGTQAAALLTIDVESGTITKVLDGHGRMRERGNKYAGEVWGCAASPADPNVYATAGDDATLRLWDASTRKMTACYPTEGRGRCVSWKQDGSRLAVGTLEGHTLIIDPTNGSVLGKLPCKKAESIAKEVSAVKWSPKGDKIGVSSHTGTVELFFAGDFEFCDTLSGCTSACIHFDWSEDGAYIQCMSNGYELLFFDVEGVTMQTASALNDTKWANWSLTLGWPVQGIYPPYADGTDVNAVAVSPDGGVIARADDNGEVNLLRYPCLVKGCDATVGKGHSSHVTNVQWIAGGSKIISTGGHDLCTFQWNVV